MRLNIQNMIGAEQKGRNFSKHLKNIYGSTKGVSQKLAQRAVHVQD